MRNYSGLPRGFIIFAQVFGTFMSVIGLIIYGYYLDDIIHSVNDGNTDNLDLTYAIFSIILALLVFFVWKSIYSAVVIIETMRRMDDQEIIANKWIIISLSLTVGGFFTPFIMNSFPNNNTQSTISTRVFLSRVFGVSMLIGGAIFMATYAGYMQSHLYPTIDPDNVSGISTAVFIITGLSMLIGVLASALFLNKNANENINNNNFLGIMMKIVSVVILLVVSLELIIVMFYSLMQLFRAFASLVRSADNRNVFGIIFALLNVALTIVYVGYMLYITSRVLVGIWKDRVTFKEYEPIERKQEGYSNNTYYN